MDVQKEACDLKVNGLEEIALSSDSESSVSEMHGVFKNLFSTWGCAKALGEK